MLILTENFCNLLISNFLRVLNAICFLLGDSPATKFYMPTFRNTLSVPSSQAGRCVYTHLPVCEDGTDSVPKRRNTTFRSREITQKKVYNFCNLSQSPHINVDISRTIKHRFFPSTLLYRVFHDLWTLLQEVIS